MPRRRDADPAPAVAATTAPAGKPGRAEKARRTRERLLRAATEIVGEAGYAGTSIAKITARARVAQGTFYNYFESRQDILDQLLPNMGLDLVEFVRRRITETRGPVVRERARITAFFDYLQSHPHFYRILNEAEIFAPAAFSKHMDNMVESYRKTLRHDVDASDGTRYSDAEIEAVTYMLLAARNYLSMRYGYKHGKVCKVPRHVIDAYTKLVTGGLFDGSS